MISPPALARRSAPMFACIGLLAVWQVASLGLKNDSFPTALEAIRAIAPDAQLAWEAPMACGYGACYGCVVEIDGELKRLCVEGPVLGGSPRAAFVASTRGLCGEGRPCSS